MMEKLTYILSCKNHKVSEVVYQKTRFKGDWSMSSLIKYILLYYNILNERCSQHYYNGTIRSHGQDIHNKRFSEEEII